MFRFLSFGLTMVVMAGFLVGSLAGAADSASLVTTVTPGTISVTVNAAAFDYGAVPLGGAKSSNSFVATNNGNVAENFLIKGSNATYSGTFACPTSATPNTCDWALSANPGTDSFRYTFTPAGGQEANLTTANQTLASNVTPGAASSFNLKFYTPASAGPETSMGKTYSTTVSISAVWAGQ